MTTRASQQRLSPQTVEQQKENERIKLREQALLKQAFCETFATEHGKKVLKWMMEQCSYQRPIIVADPHTGESLNTTLYAEGRRTLYLRIRNYLHRDILSQVETGLEGADGSEDLLT